MGVDDDRRWRASASGVYSSTCELAREALGQISVVKELPWLVWFAGVSWDGIAGTDRHMAGALAKYAQILWVDPPVSPLTPKRFAPRTSRWPVLKTQRIDGAVLRFTPKVLPLHSRGVMRVLTAWLVRVQTRHVLQRLGARPYAVVASHLDDVLRGWEAGTRTVLYGTDDYVAGAGLTGGDSKALGRAERRQLRNASQVVVVSDSLAERWRQRGFGGEIGCVPNGVNVSAYAASPSDTPGLVSLPRPVAGLIGQLSSRIDIGLLESVVESGMSLLLVGPWDGRWERVRMRRLLESPRVHWAGPVPFEELPGYMRSIDVGITPYAQTDFNRASFPLKTLEYLAAGKPAVSTDLPAVRWLGTELVVVADGAAFGQEARRAADTGTDGDMAELRKRFAREHSWDARAEMFAREIGLRARSACSHGRSDISHVPVSSCQV